MHFVRGSAFPSVDAGRENRSLVPRSRRTDPLSVWSFVYGFFSNGTPFDAPNRSEPCPLS